MERESNGAKIKEARDANRARYAKQVIQITPGWRIERADEQNWVIIRKDGAKWHYGRLLHAIQSIPHKLLNEGDKTTLKDIFSAMESIEKIIDRLDLGCLKEIQGGQEVSI